MKFIFIFPLSVFLFCCSSDKKTNIAEKTDSIVTDTVVKEQVDSAKTAVAVIKQTDSVDNFEVSNPAIPYHQDDEFVRNAWTFNPTVEEFKNKFGPKVIIEKEPFENYHVPGQIDTLVKIKAPKALVEFYRFSDEDVLVAIDIDSNYFNLNKDIHVGMDKDEFIDQFYPESFGDTLKIGDLEQGNVFVFIFKNNSLNNIKYCKYMD